MKNPMSTWKWNFGDGKYSTEKSPTHTYSAAGTYTVKLTATNAAGSSTKTKSNYVKVSGTSQAPTADFWGWPLSGKAPLKVTFTETSKGSPTSCEKLNPAGDSIAFEIPAHVQNGIVVLPVRKYEVRR